MTVRDELEQRLTEIAGLVRRSARRGHGHSYFAGDREVAHFHGDQRMDVRLTRELIHRRMTEKAFDERVRTRGPSADWVAVHVAEVRDLTLAVSLVKEAMRANARLGDVNIDREKVSHRKSVK